MENKETKKSSKDREEQTVKRMVGIVSVLQNVAMGDVSKKIRIPEKEDEFTELLVAINLMIDDLKEANREQKEHQEQLEQKVQERVKKLHTTEKRYKTLYESSKDAIMTLEPPTWGFTSGNPATLKMFMAKDEKEFTSKTPGDLSSKRQPDGQLSSVEAKKMIEKATKEGSNYFEWTHRRLNGEEFPTTVLLTRMDVDDKQILQATVRDITKQRETANKIDEKVKELERMNVLMTGRELKMVELKKEILELKNKLKK